jgi:type II secretion system protein N
MCTFVIGVQLVFPYARVVDRVVGALSADHDVRIDRLERGWLPGRFTLRGVHITTRGGEPFALTFDRIDVDLELRALLTGRIASRVDARGEHGRLRGRADEGSAGVDVDLVATDLPLARLTGGTPLAGEPELRLRLHLESGALSAVRGEVDIACDDCVLDSQTRVRLGRVAGRAAVSEGIACLAPLRGRSDDGVFTLQGGVRLSDDIAGTRADLLAGFEPSAAFRAAAGHRDLVAGLQQGRIARAARGRIASLRWTATAQAAADPCARIRQPEPAAPTVAAAPSPARVAAAPAEPEPPPEPPEPAPAPLEPEIPLAAPPPPAAQAGEPAPELPLEY